MMRFFVRIALTKVINLFSESGVNWVEIGGNSEKSFNNPPFSEISGGETT
jgi:hypothetical protein